MSLRLEAGGRWVGVGVGGHAPLHLCCINREIIMKKENSDGGDGAAGVHREICEGGSLALGDLSLSCVILLRR